jgi:hypothetical protein
MIVATFNPLLVLLLLLSTMTLLQAPLLVTVTALLLRLHTDNGGIEHLVKRYAATAAFAVVIT